MVYRYELQGSRDIKMFGKHWTKPSTTPTRLSTIPRIDDPIVFSTVDMIRTSSLFVSFLPPLNATVLVSVLIMKLRRVADTYTDEYLSDICRLGQV